MYVVLAYAFSWAWWIPMALAGQVARPGQGWPTDMPGLLGPALAAIVVTAVTDGRAGLRELWSRVIRCRVSWVWYAVIGGTACLALIPLALGTGSSAADFVAYSGAPSAGALVVVAYVVVVNGFGEEIGWRGFLADRLLTTSSRIKTALLVWVVWAGWHLPLFWVVANFRELGLGGRIGWAAGLLCGSICLTWLYQSAGRSILVVALWHTAFNFATATRASAGVAAAVASTAVMIATVAILVMRSTWRRPDVAGEAPAPEASLV
jgi:membrane protease YdiL (CAAX protease family)